jgi:hypothetical protein
LAFGQTRVVAAVASVGKIRARRVAVHVGRALSLASSAGIGALRIALRVSAHLTCGSVASGILASTNVVVHGLIANVLIGLHGVVAAVFAFST